MSESACSIHFTNLSISIEAQKMFLVSLKSNALNMLVTKYITLLVLATVSRIRLAQDDGECTSNDDCMNGGICDLDVSDTNDLNHLNKVCQCIDDYIGAYCADQCLITCQNGGVCVRWIADEHGGGEIDSSEFICQCPSPYDGPLCATKMVNESMVTENDVSSSPVTAPSMTESQGFSQSSTQTDRTSSSSESIAKIFAIVIGVGLVVATLLLYAIYSKRRTRRMDGSSQKNTIDGTTASLGSNDVADAIAADDGSIGEGNKIVTITTHNATITMTEDGPQFVPDTNYSHKVKLYDVA